MTERPRTTQGTIRRRRLAVAGFAVLLSAAAYWFLLGGPGTSNTRGAQVSSLTIESKAVGEKLPLQVVVPEGADGEKRPLLVFLHGRGANERSEEVDQMYSALADLGDQAPVIAFPYGGDASYWHNRDSGNWSKYVTDEVIPTVEKNFYVDPKAIGIGGISMGGYGAYEIAAENPGEFCAVGGHSPAVWQEAGETAEGAFDDAGDFAAHDVIAKVSSDPASITGAHLWIDAGDQDPFQPGTTALGAALKANGADLEQRTFPGAHETGYWDAHWGDYLGFYGAALANC